MKKVLVIAALGVFVLASCKKDYVCKCTIDGETYTYDLGKIKKKDAKDACDSAGSIWLLAGGTCDYEKK
ncbi:MAG: hypothetical protein HYU67_12545 [Flavobacteriia bacterium]|nr:hypothetical protein [Flavobacteriia bacterium]